jgi:hypothetical protein
MKWTYVWDGNGNAIIYDHNGDKVTTATNTNEIPEYAEDKPKRISPDGVPVDPDVRGAITDYLTNEIENETWPSTDAKETYIRTAQTVLAAGMIEEK